MFGNVCITNNFLCIDLILVDTMLSFVINLTGIFWPGSCKDYEFLKRWSHASVYVMTVTNTIRWSIALWIGFFSHICCLFSLPQCLLMHGIALRDKVWDCCFFAWCCFLYCAYVVASKRSNSVNTRALTCQTRCSYSPF